MLYHTSCIAGNLLSSLREVGARWCVYINPEWSSIFYAKFKKLGLPKKNVGD